MRAVYLQNILSAQGIYTHTHVRVERENASLANADSRRADAGAIWRSCARSFSVLFESFHNKNLKNRLKVKKKKVGTRSDRNRGPGHKDVVLDVPSPPCPPALPTGENEAPGKTARFNSGRMHITCFPS